MNSDGLIEIGRIVAPHGVMGVLKLQALTDYPERFGAMSDFHLYTREGKYIRSLKINKIRQIAGKGFFLVDADGVNDRNSAEALRDARVMIHESERYSLSEGEYWIDDILGMDIVENETGEVLGKLMDVIDSGENDIYEMLMLDGSRKLIPAVKQFIRHVDVDRNVMYISVIEGLLD